MDLHLARHERISFAMHPLESLGHLYTYISRSPPGFIAGVTTARAGPVTFTHLRLYLRASLSHAERDSGYWIAARAKYRPRRRRRRRRRWNGRSIDRRRRAKLRMSREAKRVPVSILGDENVPFLCARERKIPGEELYIRIRGFARSASLCSPLAIGIYRSLWIPYAVELVMLEDLLIVTSKLLLQLFNLCSRRRIIN